VILSGLMAAIRFVPVWWERRGWTCTHRVISAVELTRFGSVINYAMSLAAAEKWSYAV